MEKGPTTKLSFSLSSKSSTKPFKPASLPGDEGGREDEGSAAAKPQYITVFDPSQPFSDVGPIVIPPVPNSYRPDSNTGGDGDTQAASDGPRFVLDAADEAAAASGITYGLTVRPSSATRQRPTEEDGESIPRDNDLMRRKFREDIKNLPEDRGLREFEEIRLEDFGAAVLRGYGWSEGQVIGRKKNLTDPKVVEFRRMRGTHGLGYNPAAGDPRKRKRTWVGREQEKDNRTSTVSQKSELDEAGVGALSSQVDEVVNKVDTNLLI